MLKIDDFEIHSVVTGTFALDGGAMFGVVPRVLWTSRISPDDQNRIPLTTRTLIVVNRSLGRVILVDTGFGNKWSAEKAERFAYQPVPGSLERKLREEGLSLADVTDIVITHLHFDHNGGLTEWVEVPGGPTKLCFPRARHWIHRQHWNYSGNPHTKDRPSFLSEDSDELGRREILSFVEGDNPPPMCEGVEWLVSHGHTHYQLHPVIGTGSQRLVFAGDLVPTAAHLRLAWVMAYDVQPMMTIDEKRGLFDHAVNAGWLIAFPHDPDHGGVRLDGTVERPIIAKTLPL